MSNSTNPSRPDWPEWATPGFDFDIDGNVWPGSRLDEWLQEQEEVKVELCGIMGDGVHEYGRCKLPRGHDEDLHEDEEGNRWRF